MKEKWTKKEVQKAIITGGEERKYESQALLLFFFPRYIFIPFIMYAHLVSLSFQLVSQIRGYIAGSYTPFPLRYVPSFLLRKHFSLFLPRGLASNCAYRRCKALSTIESFLILPNKVKARPTLASNPGLKQVELEVNDVNHRGDGAYRLAK